jgi:hypothetical protein
MLALSRPPVVSSPLPSHVGEGAHVDDRGAQLRELALGQVGVGAVQRRGDDEAQHGVTEELETLVGGQAAVLVRVRAVGQRALEQRGLDAHAEGGLEDGGGRTAGAHGATSAATGAV